jgi:hypothetical protein
MRRFVGLTRGIGMHATLPGAFSAPAVGSGPLKVSSQRAQAISPIGGRP